MKTFTDNGDSGDNDKDSDDYDGDNHHYYHSDHRYYHQHGSTMDSCLTVLFSTSVMP